MIHLRIANRTCTECGEGNLVFKHRHKTTNYYGYPEKKNMHMCDKCYETVDLDLDEKFPHIEVLDGDVLMGTVEYTPKPFFIK